ncbi:hypothetical protein MTO96_038572 [Rhipicephalus appendiculatus]
MLNVPHFFVHSERVKPLWCVYDNRVDERPWRFLPRDIPTAQRTAVVYAYLGLSPCGRNLTSYKPDFDFGPGKDKRKF